MTHNNIKLQNVTELVPYARNSRTHSDEQIAQIAASIREFGWTNPVLVDKNNTIIAGHGRVLAARRLGMDEVPTLSLEHLTDAQVRAYVIADNKLALNAGWDDALLASELEALKQEGFELGIVGFTEQELEELRSFAEENEKEEVVKYSTELDQESNYVVLKFSKDIDWIQAETLLGIESTYSLRQNGKTWSKGVGRVLDGPKTLKLLGQEPEQDLVACAKKIDSEHGENQALSRQELAKLFIANARLRTYNYYCSSTGAKAVVVAGGYAFAFTSKKQVLTQREIADKLDNLFVPVYFWGQRVIISPACETSEVSQEWVENCAKFAKTKNITDITKRNCGRIGERHFVFDAVNDLEKHPA